MKITELTPQKKNPNRFNLHIDENFFCGLSVNTVAKYNLYQGQEINQKQLDEMLANDLENRFYDRAVTYLGRALKPEAKIRQYLKDIYYKKRGDWFDEDALTVDDLDGLIERVIARLHKFKFLNDEMYAQMFVEGRLNYKQRSMSVIKSELIGKGVERDLAEQVCTDLAVDDIELAKAAYKKKYKESAFKRDEQKKVDYLRRKGFNWSVISELMEAE